MKGERLDVSKEYAATLDRLFSDVARLARGEEFIGPYLTMQQLRGKIEFVCWVNPGRRASLEARFKKINWTDAEKNAIDQNLLCIV